MPEEYRYSDDDKFIAFLAILLRNADLQATGRLKDAEVEAYIRDAYYYLNTAVELRELDDLPDEPEDPDEESTPSD